MRLVTMITEGRQMGMHQDALYSRCVLQLCTVSSLVIYILRQISGVRSKSAVSIILAELGLTCLPDQWLLRAATFWIALAALRPTSIYKRMALDASAWAKGVSSATRRTG